jgi:hypothetical protein
MEENITNTTEDVPKIRTFQSDIADALKQKQGSVIKIAVAENERKQNERIAEKNAKKSNVGFIFGGIILLLLATGVGFFLWKKNQSLVYQAPLTTVKTSSLVSFDKAKEVLVSENTNIVSEFEKIANTDQTVGEITKVIFTETDENKQKKVFSLDTLLQKSNVEIPQSVISSVDLNNYFVGTLAESVNERFK